MLKSFCVYFIILNAVLQIYAALQSPKDNEALNVAAAYNDDCLTNSLEQTLYCRGSRAIRNVINNLNKSDKPIVIIRGLEIVRSDKNTSRESSTMATNSNNDVVDDDSFLGRLSGYLRTHELNIKFSDLFAEESERFMARDLVRNGVKIGTTTDGSIEEARKKDKGQGMLMVMAMMFAKLLAVMGLGGIGALALKALGVAMAALMMAGIVGLKTLSQHGGGHETSHSVQYLTADGHHHRRRRSLELIKQLYTHQRHNQPYRSWMPQENFKRTLKNH